MTHSQFRGRELRIFLDDKLVELKSPGDRLIDPSKVIYDNLLDHCRNNPKERVGHKPTLMIPLREYEPKFVDKWLDAVTERCLNIMSCQQYKENAMLIKCRRVVTFDHPRITKDLKYWSEKFPEKDVSSIVETLNKLVTSTIS